MAVPRQVILLLGFFFLLLFFYFISRKRAIPSGYAILCFNEINSYQHFWINFKSIVLFFLELEKTRVKLNL